MGNVKSPLAYTGRVEASTQRSGQAVYDSDDFSVAVNGKVSLSGTGAMETLTGDSGTGTPAAGNVQIVGGTGLTTIGSGATITTSIDETGIRYAEIAVSNAEIKALAATPKTLVAAPGAGKCVEFISALIKLNYGTNVLSESDDNLSVRYTDGSGVIVSGTIQATGFIDQAADTYTNAIPVIDAIVAATGCENKALVLDNIGNGEFGGNAGADTTLTVGVAYRIHTL